MFEISAEERIGWKMKYIGYLPDTHVGGAQKGFCFLSAKIRKILHTFLIRKILL
jgi:hypothetical protein